MSFSYPEFLQLVGLYFYPFVRIGAMFSIIPIYGFRAAPALTKVILTIFVTIAIAPSIAMPPPVDPFTWLGVLYILQQVLIGLAIGLVFVVIFQAFVMAGHIVAMGMGLAFASMADPASGATAPVVSQYYSIIVTLMFLALNGHLLVIQVVVDTFEYLPIGIEFLNQESIWRLVAFGSYVFSAGVLVALPAITALLLINVSFGVVTRAAPALNIFAVGFPITLLTGLVMLSLTTPIILPQLQDLIAQGLDVIKNFRLSGA